jgi:peptide subunit release factor 1 (eRF1)
MSLDQTTIRDLIDLTDGIGVLSFYVGHTPAQAADPQPTTPIEIRNQLRALKAELGERDGRLAKAVDKRLGRSAAALEALLDPKASGRGRALFVGVESGETASVSVQMPFRERVVFHDRPYVRPLVAAYDEGRPAGILVVSRAGARVLRWALGEIEEVTRHTFELTDEQVATQKTGPAPSNPQLSQHGFVDRDRFEDRIDESRHRFLRGVIDDLATRAKEHGWDRVVVSGPPKLREEARGLMEAATDGIRVLQAEQAWEEASPSVIADQAWPLLRSVVRDRERALTDAALERALSGGAGAIGLRNVCAGLNQGRVAHLLYDVDANLHGYRSEEGTLHPRVEGFAAQAEFEMTREPLFVERMIEHAIATGAAVTPIEDDDAVAKLREHEGVAALLRW